MKRSSSKNSRELDLMIVENETRGERERETPVGERIWDDDGG